ncbi:MAG TPA: DNA alkylation repair protein, partial [Chitinophagales bacterium]|nr:DNA alkylation repair protein [Chitinophagales bacterium]
MAPTKTTAAPQLLAGDFIKRLNTFQSDEEKEKLKRFFKSNDAVSGDRFMGVRMGQVFTVGKEFIDMPPVEIEKLLKNPFHEIRAGAVSVMDWQARRKKTPEAHRKELYELYLKRHDGINNWDLVDRGAMYVVGGYLFDKKRDPLYRL